MKKLVSVVGKNGVEFTAAMTAEQADYYLRLAQLRAPSSSELMKEFCDLIISKRKQDTQQNKDQHN